MFKGVQWSSITVEVKRSRDDFQQLKVYVCGVKVGVCVSLFSFLWNLKTNIGESCFIITGRYNFNGKVALHL